MSIHYEEQQSKLRRILDLTSLTEHEYAALLPAFETAFLAHMDKWTLEGKPRTARAYSQYANCPLPSAADRLLFILTYLKQAPTQAFLAAAFGLTQPKANLWIHTLLPVLRQALSDCDALPSRHLLALSERLAELTNQQNEAPFFTTEPNEQSSARKTLTTRASITAARKNAIP